VCKLYLGIFENKYSIKYRSYVERLPSMIKALVQSPLHVYTHTHTHTHTHTISAFAPAAFQEYLIMGIVTVRIGQGCHSPFGDS
jgi:predicted NodU family carbamoyl transferase